MNDSNLIKCFKCNEEKEKHLIRYIEEGEEKRPICLFCAKQAGYNI